MWEFNITMRSFQQVQEFVALAAEQPFDISVGNDSQIINGKELMGMFCLDYTRPLCVKVHCGETDFLQFRRAVEQLLA